MPRKIRRRGFTKHSTDEGEDYRYPACSSDDDALKQHRAKAQNRHGFCTPTRHSVSLNVGNCVLVCLILYAIAAILVGRWLFGKESSSDGGAIGAWLDRRRLHLYQQREEETRSQRLFMNHVRFPDVEIRANRKSVPGYSRFLEELLSKPARQTNETRDSTRTGTQTGGQSTQLPPIFLQMDVSYMAVSSSYFLRDRERALAVCSPGWMCQRCLSSAFFGSFELCRDSCPLCYQSFLCSKNTKEVKQLFFPQISTQQPVTHSGIPLVVHQSWKEHLISLHHPELTRLQNAWRTSGLRYHFYTLQAAHDYVKEHFPTIVFMAYLKLGAMLEVQTVFFRLLVLFREGGVFANVDLLLETNLKAFLETSNRLTFLAVLEDNSIGHDHCLWTGFIGSEPGHSVLRLAIQHIVGLAIHGIQDKDILEGLICQNDRTRLWKFRSIDTNKAIFGSCALGRAFNQVLGRVDPFDGLNASNFPDPGTERRDMKILLMSRTDAGATRISDVEENLLIASTGMLGLPSAATDSTSKNAPLLRPAI